MKHDNELQFIAFCPDNASCSRSKALFTQKYLAVPCIFCVNEMYWKNVDMYMTHSAPYTIHCGIAFHSCDWWYYYVCACLEYADFLITYTMTSKSTLYYLIK